MRLAILVAAAALLAAPAVAQQGASEAKPACAAMDASIPADLSDWNGKAALTSAKNAAGAAAAGLTLGKGYEAALQKTPDVAFPIQPEKPGGSVSHAGLFTFKVETAGAYTVALSTPAWIDVIENGKAVSPTTFGHGPECTTIRKMVVFPLQPGVHTLQVSGNAADKMKLMVARKP